MVGILDNIATLQSLLDIPKIILAFARTNPTSITTILAEKGVKGKL